ncbi:MAG: tRNA (adenosine(37)-N6)-threonylcarbamoyltransferase complex dimerization subunit type 1 TsaB [Sulfuriferula sp.]
MKILAFDASTESCSTALWIDGVVLSREQHAGITHSQLLLPQCQAVLAEAGLNFADLDGIAYGMGPGSFTGLRIACAVAQGLAFAADVPVVGVSGLQALALATGADKVVACLDARMGEIYHAAYQRDGENYQLLDNISVCHPDAAPLLTGGWVGCGSGFKAYPAVLAARYGDALVRVDAAIYPRAQDIATLAAQQFTKGLGVAPELAAPLYIRDKVALKICER